MKYLILGLLFCSLSQATANPYLELKNGRRIQHLNIYFDLAYSFSRLLKSRSIDLKLKNAKGTGYLKGEARGCFIGSHTLSDNQVKVLMNDLELLPVESVREYLTLEVQIQNPNHRAGMVHCEYVAVNLEE